MSRGQTDQLLAWPSPFEQRTWAVESADGLGFPLAGQLVTALVATTLRVAGPIG